MNMNTNIVLHQYKRKIFDMWNQIRNLQKDKNNYIEMFQYKRKTFGM
jgi:hypothetical protein